MCRGIKRFVVNYFYLFYLFVFLFVAPQLNAQIKGDTTSINKSARDISEEEIYKKLGYSVSDSSYKIISGKFRDILILLNEISIQLKGDYDTIYLVSYLPKVNSTLTGIKKYLNIYGKTQSLRSLNAAYSFVQQYQNNLDKFEEQIDKNYQRLVRIKTIINSLDSDPIYKQLPADSVLRSQLQQQSFILNAKWKDIDLLRKSHLKALAIILVKLTNAEFSCTEILNSLKGYISLTEKSVFLPEEKPLWNARSADYNKIMEISISGSIQSNIALTIQYVEYNIEYFVYYLIAIILIYCWLNINSRKLKCLGSDRSNKKIDYLNHNSFFAGVAVVSIVFPFFLPNPPNLVVELTWFVMLISISVIGLRVWKSKFKLAWLLFIIIYILFALDNLFFETSLQERWIMMLFSLFNCIWGILMIRFIRDENFENKNAILWTFWFFLIVQSFSFLLNFGGWFNLTKILNSASINGLNFGISLQILLLILAEAVYLQLEVGKTGKLNKYFKFYGFGNQFKLVLNLFAIFIWVLAILWGLGFYYFLSEQFTFFLERPRIIGAYSFTFESILIFLIVISISTVIARFLNVFYNVGVEQNNASSRSGSWILILRLVILAGGFLLAMAAAGIPFDKLALIIGALGVGIGFGLQNVVNNLVSGVILVFEKPMGVGDIIEVGNKTGVVKEIGIRSSKILNADGADIYIPNGDLLSQQLVNWTKSNHTRKIDLRFSVNKNQSLDTVIASIKNSCEGNDLISDNPATSILIHEITDNAVVVRVVVYASESGKKDLLKSALTKKIFEDFNSVNIAYPSSLQEIYIKEFPKLDQLESESNNF